MRKVQQFRQRARECRVAAAKAANGELRRHYANLAAVWEKLADERLTFFIQAADAASDNEPKRKRRSA